MRKAIQWVRDNSLSLVFFVLFLGSLGGQSVSGFHTYLDRLKAHGRPPISHTAYFGTGDFLDAIFANWQAAILQLGCLIVFAEVFRQKGASHSRKNAGRAKKRREDEALPWIYRNSLSLAFALIFLLSLLGHIIFGTWSYNEARAMTGQAAVSTGAYLLTAKCWFTMTQTWQAEFVGIGAFLVLSIFLRQEGSAESKPVRSSDRETGETNK